MAEGVDYSKIDPTKLIAQAAALSTAKNIERFGYEEIIESRGESAYIWREGEILRAAVLEGLGTKILVADKVRELTGKSYYREIGQDTLATIVNDMAAMGALPQIVLAYFGAGSSDWFTDERRIAGICGGFRDACNFVGATWGGGESPALNSIIYPNAADLLGSAIGIIRSEKHLALPEKITHGDTIVMIESSGVHANGLTDARETAELLPKGYLTKLPNGRTFGETLLTPTHLYGRLIESIQDNDIDIHYMVNVTGHGWAKLMRADRNFTYYVEVIPVPQEEFLMIGETKRFSERLLYLKYNMGTGFVLMVAPQDAEVILDIATTKGLTAWKAGIVEEGPRQVIIEKKGIVFDENDLKIR